MIERARSVGGTLDAGPGESGGFVVTAVLPLADAAGGFPALTDRVRIKGTRGGDASVSTLHEAPQDRIFTVPNILSLARLLGVPLFLWLVLIEADWWALGLLVFAGLSDWLDGKLARAFNQTSKLGMVLDPAADRLYILATLVGLTIRDIIPLWLVLALVAREVSILPIAPIVRRLGYGGTLPVHFIGKAATMCLLYSFPLLLLGEHGGGAAPRRGSSDGPSPGGGRPCTGGRPSSTGCRRGSWCWPAAARRPRPSGRTPRPRRRIRGTPAARARNLPRRPEGS
ncbi:CDP-alcohol phosphatidyltransferase family protein [Actinomadura luteofluorescens]|uniref:CDP-alcohol phosphatidyltransferase family protein n=1 Tax=Actinomadura luteofluorescens TaxID=46163 RepID=UPI003632A1F4